MTTALRSQRRPRFRSPKDGVRDRERRILVVDDLEDNRELYTAFLTSAGFDVEQACDGVDALERVASRPPALIVMDLSMPRLDGWETTRILKSDPRTRSIRIFALTAHVDEEDLARARAAGADDVGTKPMLPRELLERVQALLGPRAARVGT